MRRAFASATARYAAAYVALTAVNTLVLRAIVPALHF